MDDKEIEGGHSGGPCRSKRTPLLQFFNGTITPFDTAQSGAVISWIGFPNRLTLKYPNDQILRWWLADETRLLQDEYLEWSVKRNEEDNITVVRSTCEGPEYWQLLGNNQDQTLRKLYRDLNPEQTGSINYKELYLYRKKGKPDEDMYNPANHCNIFSDTGVIAHLVHPSNTLRAEIDIAAQATVIRADQHGAAITDAQQLIRCSAYGGNWRSSDPKEL